MDLQQGSTEWHQFRSLGLGSSDAPVIMNASKFKTPRVLWNEKVKKTVSNDSNWATERGNRFEPIARARYEIKYGIDMVPTLFVHPDYSFIRASLDGYNEEKKLILEIKVPSKEVFEKAKAGVVDEMYEWQLEHQLLASNATCVHFYCVQLDKKNEEIIDCAKVDYYSNPEKREKLFKTLHTFWDMVIKKVPPPLTDEDWLEREDEPTKVLFRRIKEVKARMKSSDENYEKDEKIFDDLKKVAIENMKHSKEICEGVKFSKYVASGSLDFEKMKKDGIDIDKYRKPSSVRYRIDIEEAG